MMKIDTSEVKRGVVLNIDGTLYRVVETSHTHTGRGSATYSYKVKNILTGNTNNFSFKSGTALEQAEVNMNPAVFLYSSGDTYTFMENDNSEMHEIQGDTIDDIIPYLKENLDLSLMMHEGEILGVILPNVISYKIAETVPGVKGDRAQAGKKPAKTETGLEVMVPLHLMEGAVIHVNTSTGEVV